MRTAVLSHPAISKHDLETFVSIMEMLGVFPQIEKRQHGENAFTVTKCTISYDSQTDLMTREDRKSFDEDGHWGKIQKEWERVGFAQTA
ncbi:MAG TPA: hypothetical protein VK395_24160 [Gemmataceae bacterium]|nr:hypothetical protein [Gemmataceae bacterium]